MKEDKNRVFFVRFVFLGGIALLLQLGCTRTHETTSPATNATGSSWVLGLSADYPPFEFKRNGEIVGIDVDLAREISQDLGYKLTIKDMDFSALIPSLQSGLVDFVMSGMTETEDRKKSVEFSEPYYSSLFAMVYLKSAALSWKSESDMSGKTIGAQLGSTMEKYVKARAQIDPSIHLLALSKTPILIQELKATRIDGVLVEEVQALALIRAHSALAALPLKTTDSINHELRGTGYAIAFSKQIKTETLRRQVNDSLKKLQNSGVIEKIKNHWLAELQ